MNPQATAGSLRAPAVSPRRFRAHVLLTALAALALPAEGAAPPADGRAVELAEGGTRTWTVELTEGQALRARAVPDWFDIELQVTGPDGAAMGRSKGLRDAGEVEEITLLATAAGPHRLTVRAAAGAGGVRLELDGPRAATAEDGRRAAAERETQALLNRLDAEVPRAELPAVLAEADRLVAVWQELGDRRRAATLLYQQAVAWYEADEYPQAADAGHRAEPIAREAADVGLMIDILNDTGRADRKELNPTEAGRHMEEARKLCEEHGHRRQLAIVLSNLSGVANSRGEPREAVDYLRDSLRVARETGDDATAISSQVNLCGALQDLNERQEALQVCHEVLTEARRMKDRKDFEGPEKQKTLDRVENAALNNLGTLYEALGDWTKALEFHDQAVRLARAGGTREWEGRSQFNVGVVYHQLGDKEKARAAYERAWAIALETPGTELEARVLAYRSRLEVAQGETGKALELARRALELVDKLPGQEGIVRQALGEALLASGDRAGAQAQFEQAGEIHHRRGEINSEATAKLGLARVAKAAGDLRQALDHVNRGIALIESLRVRVTSPDLRASFFASNQDFYTLKIEILMELEQREPEAGHAATALQASEQAHARSLLEVVAGAADAELSRSLTPSLVERGRRASRELNDTEWRRAFYLESTPILPQGFASQLERAQREYQLFEDEVLRTSPRYAALATPETLRVGEIQSRVLDNETVLLEYALGDEKSYLWAVTSKQVESFSLPGRQQIEGAALRLYDRITARNLRLKNEGAPQRQQRLAQADKELVRIAAELSELILQPAAHLLVPGRRIVVVGDGALLYVPFAALPSPGQPAGVAPVPLLVDHEVVVLPSASVLAALRAEKRQSARKTLAVLADPVFSPDDVRLHRGGPALRLPKPPSHRSAEGGNGHPQRFARLRFAGTEAEAILDLVRSDKTYRALGFDASRRTARGGVLAGYRIVHFATHGVLDTERPEKSSLMLSLVDSRGRPQKGDLSLGDIYGLELSADLVVLSACSTALGKEVRGEGLVGLTRGFMYAGAPRVVASLWSVDDRSTADLMKLFYQGMLTDGLPPAAALRKAQLRQRQGRWSAPYHWAAFSLQGEWR
jgi:CHAT domain-containing protein/predicted negative regulator of RcsB-dependent stress response